MSDLANTEASTEATVVSSDIRLALPEMPGRNDVGMYKSWRFKMDVIVTSTRVAKKTPVEVHDWLNLVENEANTFASFKDCPEELKLLDF